MIKHHNEEERERELTRILDRVGRELDAAATSLSARARKHFSAGDADPADAIEVWGTRIGRVLALLVVLAMFIWLVSSMFARS